MGGHVSGILIMTFLRAEMLVPGMSPPGKTGQRRNDTIHAAAGMEFLITGDVT